MSNNPIAIDASDLQYYDKQIKNYMDNIASYATTGEVATAKQEAIDAAKEYADGVDTGVMLIEAGEDIVVTPDKNGKVTVAHETFTTGEYTKDSATSDKTGDVYMMTEVTVDNGHVTGAAVKSLAASLERMTFILDGGNSQI